MPKFTYCAIIPNFNDGKSFGEAFDSISRQTHPFNQIIVVDDASTDNSVEVIEQHIRGHPRVEFIQNKENMGIRCSPIGAVNAVIDKCKADFLLFCTSKDTYESTLVEHCDALLQRYPKAGAICGSIENSDKTPERLRLPPGFHTPERLLRLHWGCRDNRGETVYYCGGASMLRTNLVRYFGGLNPKLEWHSDIILYHLIAFRAGVIVSHEFFRRNVGPDSGGYSEKGMRDWKQQREVIRSISEFVRLYQPEGELFKQSGNFPWFFIGKSRSLFWSFCKDFKLICYLRRHGHIKPSVFCKFLWGKFKSKIRPSPVSGARPAD